MSRNAFHHLWVTYESSEEDIDNANESLRAEHGFPEIHGMAHLRQEGNEEDGSRVGV